MALSNKDLIKHKNKLFTVEPFSEEQLTPLGYDLRVGYAITPDGEDVLFPKDIRDASNYQNQEMIRIPAKKGVVIVTRERVYLTGKLIATVHGRARITAKGIFVNPVTVDPHWNGKLILYFYNTNNEDVEIPSRWAVATLIFHSVETSTPHHTRNTATRQLLEDGSSRYSEAVTNKILIYLNHYEDSDEEKRYLTNRDATKKFYGQPSIKRSLDYFLESFELFKVWTWAFLALFVFSMFLVISPFAYPTIGAYLPFFEVSPYYSSMFILGCLGAIFAFLNYIKQR